MFANHQIGHHISNQMGEGLHCSFTTPNPFVLTNNICLNQIKWAIILAIAYDRFNFPQMFACVCMN